MIAIDTNILVRLLANDDPKQSPRAARLFAAGDVSVAKTVLLETEWVLRFSYRMPRSTIHDAFARVLAVATVTVEDHAEVEKAVDWYGAGLDFADALHLASSASAARFMTFDSKLRRAAVRSKAVPPVELA